MRIAVERPVETGLGGPNRNAQRGGRLGQREVEVVVQHDHRALGGVDGREHAFDVQSASVTRDEASGTGASMNGVSSTSMTRPRRCRARSRQALTVSRWSQASNLLGSRKPAQVPPCPERRLLDRVARELRVPEDQPGSRVQSREVRADEHAEGLMIALACPLDETRLVHGASLSRRSDCRAYPY